MSATAGRIITRSAAAAAALLAASAAVAEQAQPANTLMDMRRQFGACLAGKPIAPTGSRVTIVFMTKRDGSIFGKPRISYSQIVGDEKAQSRFLDEAQRAVGSCLPFRVTPALGAAIAGRMFSITLGRDKPQTGA